MKAAQLMICSQQSRLCLLSHSTIQESHQSQPRFKGRVPDGGVVRSHCRRTCGTGDTVYQRGPCPSPTPVMYPIKCKHLE